MLQAKLDELIVAEEEAEAEESTGAGGEYGGEYGPEYGRGNPRAGRGGEMTEERGEAGDGEYDARTGPAAAEETASGAPYGPSGRSGVAEVTGADDPDPLGFEELANEPPVDEQAGFGSSPPYGESAGNAGYGPPASRGRVASVDRSQWATDYAAFHANFTTTTDQRGAPSLDWGELGELRVMNDAASEHLRDSSADPDRQRIREISDRLGEVRWQASIVGVETPERGGPEVRFDLPPLPDPLKIRFLADLSEHRVWTEMQPGQTVQFTGRFDIKTPNEIDVMIRMSN
jgi:hypothetical protein